MQLIDQTTQVPIPKEVIFIHDCCASGIKALKKYVLANPNVKITTISYLNCYKKKLHEKYGFKIEDLKKYCYFIDGDNIIKVDA